MEAKTLLGEIVDYCRETGVKKSAFGRLAVNDAGLVAHLRDGGRVTASRLERVRALVLG
jgi:hypothetical protein